MNGLGILFIGGIAVLFVVIAVVVMRAEDRRDPFGPEDDPDGLPPLGTMPTEIAHEPPRPSIHELPPLGDAVWHQYPVTSPAAELAPGAPGPGPGTAAAAAATPAAPPAAAPPPLPDPAYAAANPTAYPLTWLLSDTFVGALTVIRKDGAP